MQSSTICCITNWAFADTLIKSARDFLDLFLSGRPETDAPSKFDRNQALTSYSQFLSEAPDFGLGVGQLHCQVLLRPRLLLHAGSVAAQLRTAK